MHTFVDEARIKVHIGIELALDKVVVLEGGLFQGHGHLDQRLLATHLKDLVPTTMSGILDHPLRHVRHRPRVG